MISQNTIDQIFQAVRIEDVVEDFVKLKKRGVNLIGLCPFHDEKTPSFNVSPTRNIYKCFGCGRAGNAINFLMEHEGLTYPEALRDIASRYKIEVEETGKSEEYVAIKSERESLYLINQYAGDFYQKELFHSDLGKSVGLAYFKERGILRKTIDQFKLGYAPSTGDKLTTTAVSSGYNIEYLRQLGLTTSKDRDFFYNRVIFPIHNVTGKIVAFAGRQLTNQKKSPKYINSKESDVYHKSKILYGLHLAKTAIRKEELCILVEGYTDVISLFQSGIQNVVASSGTALTPDQIKLVKRYSPNILLLFDGDAAGLKAAMRGVNLILAQNMNVRLVTLPQGEDPDSYVNTIGASAFGHYLSTQSEDFIHFKAKMVMDEASDDPVKKSRMIHDIIETLAHLPDPIRRSLYIKQCAHLLQMEENLLMAEVSKIVSRNLRDDRLEKYRETREDHIRNREKIDHDRRKQGQVATSEARKLGDEFQERDIVRILLLHGNKTISTDGKELSVATYLINQVDGTLDSFDNSLYSNFIKEYKLELSKKGNVSIEYFLNHTDAELQGLAIALCHSPFHYSDNWVDRWGLPLQTQAAPEENQERDVDQALLRFILRKLNKLSEENLAKIREFQGVPEFENELVTHLATHQKILDKRNEVAKKLNTVVLR